MTDPQIELEELARKALDYADGSEAEILVSASENALTRFAENAVSQNVSRRELGITIRIVQGKRSARVTTNRVDEKSLTEAFEHAKSLLPFQKESPDILPLPEPQAIQTNPAFEESTAQVHPEARAQVVLQGIEGCKKASLRAAGVCSTGWSAVAVANTNGLLCSHKDTSSTFGISAQSEDSSGWAEASSRDFGKIDIAGLIEVAIEKAQSSRNARSFEPGHYTVVLEPAAVTDFLEFMGWFGFGGLGFVEGRTFMAGKLGQKMFGENISIVDDAYDLSQRSLPFDFEGFPRQKVTLIENGVAKAVVHDRVSAKKANAETTGHALPQPSGEGAMPFNLMLAPGDSSVEEMIASTKRGILVTRFHYTNVIDPMELVLTGLTRDGTFLIENGKIAAPLKNLRFTQSILEAMKAVEAISRERITMLSEWGMGAYTVPALKISRFNFSSETGF